jgi:pimeloyl-ACP methyl ester carboxylesterase
MRWWTVLVAVVVAARGGCAARPAGPAPVGADCLTGAERAGAVRFPSGSGAELAGVVLGTGRTGVVLAHGQHGGLCEVAPYGRVLAGRGYRVLLFDFNSFGASGVSPDAPANPHYDRDVAAAAGRLRAAGADRVLVVGTETGGLAAVVAATDVTPPLSGVVDLSGPAAVSGMDARAAAARLAVPALFVVGTDDPWYDEVRSVYAADRAADRQLEVVPGAAHGVGLVEPDGPAAATVAAFLAAHD